MVQDKHASFYRRLVPLSELSRIAHLEREYTRGPRLDSQSSSKSTVPKHSSQFDPAVLQTVDFAAIVNSSTGGGGGLPRPYGRFLACRNGNGLAIWTRLPVHFPKELLKGNQQQNKEGMANPRPKSVPVQITSPFSSRKDVVKNANRDTEPKNGGKDNSRLWRPVFSSPTSVHTSTTIKEEPSQTSLPCSAHPSILPPTSSSNSNSYAQSPAHSPSHSPSPSHSSHSHYSAAPSLRSLSFGASSSNPPCFPIVCATFLKQVPQLPPHVRLEATPLAKDHLLPASTLAGDSIRTPRLYLGDERVLPRRKVPQGW